MPSPPRLTPQDGIDSLYEIAVVEGKATSTRRLRTLADYCAQELRERGLSSALTEQNVPGGGRTKQWDIVWSHEGRPRLAISLKSILRNVAGTVPNRLDDLMGEVANAQLESPEIVLGYLMVFDVSADAGRDDGQPWSDFLAKQLSRLSGRAAPHWTVGTVEQAVLIRVDFSRGPHLVSGAEELPRMFDTLVAATLSRNPGV